MIVNSDSKLKIIWVVFEEYIGLLSLIEEQLNSYYRRDNSPGKRIYISKMEELLKYIEKSISIFLEDIGTSYKVQFQKSIMFVREDLENYNLNLENLYDSLEQIVNSMDDDLFDYQEPYSMEYFQMKNGNDAIIHNAINSDDYEDDVIYEIRDKDFNVSEVVKELVSIHSACSAYDTIMNSPNGIRRTIEYGIYSRWSVYDDETIKTAATYGNILLYKDFVIACQFINLKSDALDNILQIVDYEIGRKGIITGNELYDLLVRKEVFAFDEAYITCAFDLFCFVKKYLGNKFAMVWPFISKIEDHVYSEKDAIQFFLTWNNSERTRIDIETFLNNVKNADIRVNNTIDFINEYAKEWLIESRTTMVKKSEVGLTREIERSVVDIVCRQLESKSCIAIRDLKCFHIFPQIKTAWTDWMVYSILKNYSSKVRLLLSSRTFQYSVPIVTRLDVYDEEEVALIAERYANDFDMVSIRIINTIDDISDDILLEEDFDF